MFLFGLKKLLFVIFRTTMVRYSQLFFMTKAIERIAAHTKSECDFLHADILLEELSNPHLRPRRKEVH